MKGSALRHFDVGRTLYDEGDEGGSVLLVLEGRVALRHKGHRSTVNLASVGPLGWLGITSLADGGPRTATAHAEEPVVALEVDRGELLSLIERHPEAGLDLLETFTQRIRAGQTLLDQMIAEGAPAPEGDVKAVEAFAGSSMAARRVRSAAIAAAAVTSPVLVVGEPGTGKSMLARCIHDASHRASGAFVRVSCGLVSDTMLEGRLFGYTRGALPGATEGKPGAVEEADGGSVLLKDIDEMPRSLQSVVVRFLERGEFHRLGETRLRRSNVRILSTSSKDLEVAQRDGRLRRDLYSRLDLARIEIPPLRERHEDVPILVSLLMRDIAGRLSLEPLRVAPSALGVLSRYSFPGNVDELANEIERLLITLDPGSVAGPLDLSPRFVSGDPVATIRYSEAVRAFKAHLISSAIAECGGNRALAAERLGLHRSNLSRMIRDLELDEIV